MIADNTGDIIRYYLKKESRIGYSAFLNGTKHFGYYNDGDNDWDWQGALRRMEDKLGRTLDLAAGSEVLDAGCGVGDVACRVAANFGLRVHGVDLLDFNLKEADHRAKRRGLESLVSFSKMDYSKLSFPERMFDGLYTMESLVHAASSEAVLGEFNRVLKPGGRLVLFEYARAPDEVMPMPAARAFAEVNRLAVMPSFQRFKYGVLEGQMQEAGFSSVTVEDITHHMLPMLRGFALIGHYPYMLARVLGQQHRIVNTMSAVELWRYRKYFRYNVYCGVKR